MGLVFLGPFSFAQTSDQQNTQDNIQETNQETIHEDHDTKNLDKLLENYNKDQAKVLKDKAKLNTVNDSAEVIESKGEIKEVAHREEDVEAEIAHTVNGKKPFDPNRFKKKINSDELKKIKYSEALKVALAPLQAMPESELRQLLLDNTKGSSAEEYVARFPKLLNFTVALIRDPVALPKMALIIEDQKRLIRYASLMLFTILFSIILKRFLKKEGRGIIAAVGLWFMRFLIINSLRLGILIYFFGSELTPMFNIAMKVFF